MLTIGARLGPYEIAALIGHGGMGEVYRARDTRLDRDVATFSAGTPTKLFDTRFVSAAGGRTYDVSPDGQQAGGVEGAPADEVAARLPVPGLAEGKGSRSFDPVHPYNQRRVALTPGTRLGTSMNVISGSSMNLVSGSSMNLVIGSSGYLVIGDRRC